MTRGIATLALAGAVLGMLLSTVQAQERDEVLQSVSEGEGTCPTTTPPPDASRSGARPRDAIRATIHHRLRDPAAPTGDLGTDTGGDFSELGRTPARRR